ncbi:hypothetical protein SKAU_G00189470 [Synaphobranchus kaupii]|uniref:Uncharacterized protein n=1 Tax=Synaphobranchus kaupii TaxID=118154 RepID=A0A9Q1IX44_SYNKA|nr:hypothetical protein SKAU_G00189470 [Synaphobranchus kaupii]
MQFGRASELSIRIHFRIYYGAMPLATECSSPYCSWQNPSLAVSVYSVQRNPPEPPSFYSRFFRCSGYPTRVTAPCRSGPSSSAKADLLLARPRLVKSEDSPNEGFAICSMLDRIFKGF